MVGVVICRKAIVGVIGIALKHRKNTTLTKYQKMPLILDKVCRENIRLIGLLIMKHHSNPATDFFIIAVVGNNGI